MPCAPPHSLHIKVTHHTYTSVKVVKACLSRCEQVEEALNVIETIGSLLAQFRREFSEASRPRCHQQ